MIVLDNGAHSIKVTNGSLVHTIPNCIARSKDDRRIYIANQLDAKKTLSTLQFKRAHEKGFLTNWHVEKAIWDQFFSTIYSDLDVPSTGLLLTEAPYAPATLQGNTDEMVFEEYRFSEYLRTTTASLIPWGSISPPPPPSASAALDTASQESGVSCREVVLVVDSGYSFTHITPVIHGCPGPSVRLSVGGKFLTNALKEQISFRQYNMMDEFQLIDNVKEECCFVSLDFEGDMERARRGEVVARYVLPDFSRGSAGFRATEGTMMTDDMQVLELKYELFSVPELLFTPSDIGMQESGLVQGVMDAMKGLPDEIAALCLENIVLIGGNTKFPGFVERFERDLRASAPDEYEIAVFRPNDPITFAAECGLRMSQAEAHMREVQVTREEYLETNKRATMKFNQIHVNGDRRKSTNGQSSPDGLLTRRKETTYDETSDRSDTPRSFSPDTDPEDEVKQED